MIDWKKLHSTRKEIDKLERELKELYNLRKDFIIEMADYKMKQREIGAYWGISNPRVSQIINGLEK